MPSSTLLSIRSYSSLFFLTLLAASCFSAFTGKTSLSISFHVSLSLPRAGTIAKLAVAQCAFDVLLFIWLRIRIYLTIYKVLLDFVVSRPTTPTDPHVTTKSHGPHGPHKFELSIIHLLIGVHNTLQNLILWLWVLLPPSLLQIALFAIERVRPFGFTGQIAILGEVLGVELADADADSEGRVHGYNHGNGNARGGVMASGRRAGGSKIFWNS